MVSEVNSQAGHLYSPTLVTVATIIGSPFAGCLLLAHNCRVLGNESTANKLILWGIVSTIALLILAFFLPASIPNIALPLASTIAMREVAKGWFANDYAGHVANGGAKGTVWKAILTGIICLVGLLLALYIALLVLPIQL